MTPDLITQVFNVFDPHESLPPGDPRYVECSEERGSVGLLKTLARTISRSTGCTSQLLSGHRGCGKTTELLRLRQDLLTNEPRFFVIYCEAEQYIDLNDVEYTDVLLGVVQQLWADMQREGIKLEPGKLGEVVDELKNIFTSPVEIKELGVGVGAKAGPFSFDIAKLGLEIKKNPNHRQLVRAHLRPRATSFLEAVNEVIQNAEAALKTKGYSGLVVIVDNLDRVFRNVVPNTNFSSHEVLFIDGADYLRSIQCDVLYTVPPSLLHSAQGGRLANLYGTPPQMLPMIPVATRTGEEFEPGVAKLSEAVEKRLQVAGATLDTAFDTTMTQRRLCSASGGYIRNLMTMMRTATNYLDELPITASAVEQTVRDVRDGFVRTVHTAQQWQVLRTVAQTRQVADTEDSLQMLDSFAVLEYRDSDGPWYDVNAVVREAREFKA